MLSPGIHLLCLCIVNANNPYNQTQGGERVSSTHRPWGQCTSQQPLEHNHWNNMNFEFNPHDQVWCTYCHHPMPTQTTNKRLKQKSIEVGVGFWVATQHQTIKRPKMCFDPKEHVPGKLGSQEERKDWPIIVWIVVLQLVTIAVTSWIWIWNRLQELVKVLLPNEWGLEGGVALWI